MSGRQRRADAALAALQADAQERRAERDRLDGEPRATIRHLVAQAQNAAHNGDTEAEQVAREVVEQLVALAAPGTDEQRHAWEVVHGIADDALAALPDGDPARRAHAASDAIATATALRGRFAEVRREAVRALRATPMTWAEVGTALGVTAARAQQLADLPPSDPYASRGPRGAGTERP